MLGAPALSSWCALQAEQYYQLYPEGLRDEEDAAGTSGPASDCRLQTGELPHLDALVLLAETVFQLPAPVRAPIVTRLPYETRPSDAAEL